MTAALSFTAEVATANRPHRNPRQDRNHLPGVAPYPNNPHTSR